MGIIGWIRLVHRWVSILFTLGVLANIAAIALTPDTPAVWVGLLALLPLIALLLTGLVLLAAPYARRRPPSPVG